MAAATNLVLLEPGAAAAAPPFPAALRQVLVIAADAIIPAEGAMPSASQAGAVTYLERRAAREAEFSANIRRFLAQKSLASPSNIVAALRELERTRPKEFAEFRDAVYEAYYTNPAIWNLLGYRFRISASPDEPLPEFDEGVLSTVARMQPIYREAE
jgi:hypothetical protein